MTTRNPGDKKPRARRPGLSARKPRVAAPAPAPAPPPPPPPVVSPPAQLTESFGVMFKRTLSEKRKKLTMIGGVGVVLLMFLVGVCSFVGAEDPVVVELPTPTPLPTVEALPTSTAVPFMVVATPTPRPPRPLNEIVPFNQRGYLTYRFYHAWEELSHCRLEYEEVLLLQEEARLQSQGGLTNEEIEASLAIAAAADAATTAATGIAPEIVEPTPTPTPTPGPTRGISDAILEQEVLLNLRAEIQWLLKRYDTGECLEPLQFTGMAGRTKWLLWAAGYSSGATETEE